MESGMGQTAFRLGGVYAAAVIVNRARGGRSELLGGRGLGVGGHPAISYWIVGVESSGVGRVNRLGFDGTG